MHKMYNHLLEALIESRLAWHDNDADGFRPGGTSQSFLADVLALFSVRIHVSYC